MRGLYTVVYRRGVVATGKDQLCHNVPLLRRVLPVVGHTAGKVAETLVCQGSWRTFAFGAHVVVHLRILVLCAGCGVGRAGAGLAAKRV